MKHYPQFPPKVFKDMKGNGFHISCVSSGTQTCFQWPHSGERATTGSHLSAADTFLSPLSSSHPSAYPDPAMRSSSEARPHGSSSHCWVAAIAHTCMPGTYCGHSAWVSPAHLLRGPAEPPWEPSGHKPPSPLLHLPQKCSGGVPAHAA